MIATIGRIPRLRGKLGDNARAKPVKQAKIAMLPIAKTPAFRKIVFDPIALIKYSIFNPLN